MATISIQDVQRDPLGCLSRVEGGETLVVLRDDQPVAEIKPTNSAADETRPYGICKGEFVVPDDFDAPLPDEILREFEGR
jgi:antitoxin (DNA-binding transcriptional repressor) of toxin-antitoxin stability system